MRQTGSEFVSFVSSFFVDIGPEGRWLYWAFVALIFFGLILSAFVSALPAGEKLAGTKSRFNAIQSETVFAVLLFVFIFLSKFPSAIIGHINPDEHVWIGCAKTLAVEPRLWLACDTSTSGPMVVLPLLLLKIFNLPIDVGTTKLISSIILAGVAVYSFKAYVNLFGGWIARATILPLAIAVSLAASYFFDYIPYNGEQVSMLLLSMGLYLFSRIYVAENIPQRSVIWLGIVLGTVPFAKLQAVPLALTIAFFSFVTIAMRNPRRLWTFIPAGLIPGIFFVSWIALLGDFRNFWTTYIQFNLLYAGMTTPEGTSLLGKFAFALKLVFDVINVFFFVKISIVLTLLCVFFTNFRTLLEKKTTLFIVIFSIVFFLVTLYCIGAPYRWFHHYSFFALPAFNLMMGSFGFMLFDSHSRDNWDRNAVPFIQGAVLVIVLTYFFQSFSFNPGYFGYAEQRKDEYFWNAPVAKELNKFSNKGDRLAVWGWSGTWYSDTDLIMGTRFTDTAGIFMPNAFSDYFLKIFMLDLRRNQPRIILDAISPRENHKYRSSFGFENFHEVKEYIEQNYDLREEIDGYRIYVRK